MENERISHYRILEKLGAGSMGEVYLVQTFHQLVQSLLQSVFVQAALRPSGTQTKVCATILDPHKIEQSD